MSSNSASNLVPKNKSNQAHRAWMFTINNPVAKTLPDRFINNSVYCIHQVEKGSETGTVHIQGYLVLKPNPKNKNGYTMKWLKDNVCPYTHWTPRTFGTHDKCVEYCSKLETRVEGPWIHGEWSDTAGPSAGGVKGGAVNKTKIMSVKEDIDKGANEEELYEKHFGEMLRYGKNFDRYRMAKQSKFRKHHTLGFVFYGPPATGKSHKVRELAMANFGDSVYYLQLDGGDRVWWDGYNGQKAVVVEEFHGQMKISYLLKLLDRYPMSVETKGSMVPFTSEMIFFTSNEHPSEWYGKADRFGAPSTIPVDVLAALKRRFEGKLGKITEMKEKIEFFDDEEIQAEEVLKIMEMAVQDPIVDLTCSEELADDSQGQTASDDDVDDKGYINVDEFDYEAEQGFMEDERLRSAAGWDDDDDPTHICELCDRPCDYCECTYEEQRAFHDAMPVVAGTPRTTAATLAPPAPKKVKRTDEASSQFAIIRPPRADPEAFRALKQVPGQTRLSVIPVGVDSAPAASQQI